MRSAQPLVQYSGDLASSIAEHNPTCLNTRADRSGDALFSGAAARGLRVRIIQSGKANSKSGFTSIIQDQPSAGQCGFRDLEGERRGIKGHSPGDEFLSSSCCLALGSVSTRGMKWMSSSWSLRLCHSVIRVTYI